MCKPPIRSEAFGVHVVAKRAWDERFVYEDSLVSVATGVGGDV